MPKPDFASINAAALARLPELLESWLPGGVIEGREYKCADLTGGEGRSLSVNIETGVWADFASEARGSDPVSLLAAIRKCGMGAAARELQSAPSASAPSKPRVAKAVWATVFPVPDSAPPPEFRHSRFGTASKTWRYLAAHGALLGYVCRFDGPEGKQVLPLTWCKCTAPGPDFIRPGNKPGGRARKAGETEWRWQAFDEPRPLYGLDRLAERPKAPVLLVEGEKCADAAQDALQDWAVLTWPGGSSAAQKVEWGPLQGRSVTIWPDADDAGAKAAATVLAALPKARLLTLPADAPDGWDVADALADGWTPERVRAYVSPEPPRKPATPAQTEPDGPDHAWRFNLLAGKQGPLKLVANVIQAIRTAPQLRGMVGYDEFAECTVLMRPAPWRPDAKPGTAWQSLDDTHLAAWLQLNGLQVGADLVAQGVEATAPDRTVHPVREYLDSLSWDGKPRITDWARQYLGCPDPDAWPLARLWLISAIARVYQPGCQADHMIILEGRQGNRKSTALRTLCGDHWFRDSLPTDLNNKDAGISVHGVWIVEWAELSGMKRADAEVVKGFISRRVDSFRPPYGRRNQVFPRQCVFAGSTNADAYMLDSTGNRRFWPIQCTTIDVDALHRDRDLLWAEARDAYFDGKQWWPDALQSAGAADLQESRFAEDLWTDEITRFVETEQAVRVSDILEGCFKALDKSKWGQGEARRIAAIMQKLGWYRKRLRVEYVRVSGGMRRYEPSRTRNDWFYLRPGVHWDGTRFTSEAGLFEGQAS